MEDETKQIREIFFLQVLESLKEAIIIIRNTNQEIIFYNKAAEKLFGHPAVDVISEHIELLIVKNVDISKLNKASAPTRTFGITNKGMKFPIEVSLSQFASITVPYEVIVVRTLTDVYREVADIKNTNNRLKEFNTLLGKEVREPLNIISNYLLNFIKNNEVKFDSICNRNLHFALQGINRLKMLADSMIKENIDDEIEQIEPRKDILFNDGRPVEREALTVLLNTAKRLEKINLNGNTGEI